MADQKNVFPMMPVTHWWALRERFKNSIPGVVTAAYVATALKMQEVSARTNVIPPLKQIGIIDDDGKPKERAKEWRDDQKYAGVCKAIAKEIYPAELSDACPDATTDRACVERWFAARTGSGKIAVGKMATFYVALLDADVAKAPRPKAGKRIRTTKAKPALTTPKKPPLPPPQKDAAGRAGHIESAAPSIHLNLEVHISADASPDQIDKIFESMANHIYRKKN